MTVTIRTGEQIAVDTAREAAQRAAVQVAQVTGTEITDRPVYAGSTLTRRDVEPVSGLQAARQVELAARHHARGYIKEAREAGTGWREIGEALGLGPSAEAREMTVAEAAFNYAAPSPDSHWSRTYGSSISWRCGSCTGLVTDRGPEAGLGDAETGHADGCTRRAAGLSEWDRQWEAG